jgi:hypothetical protein
MLNNLHAQYKKSNLGFFSLLYLTNFKNKVEFSYDAQMLHEIVKANSIKSNSLTAQLPDHKLTLHIYNG